MYLTIHFSDCCSHVLVQNTNDDQRVYRRIEKLHDYAYSDIFTVFEREAGTTYGRQHYKSLDGKYTIDYADCGVWSIKPYELRYTFNMSDTETMFIASRYSHMVFGNESSSLNMVLLMFCQS